MTVTVVVTQKHKVWSVEHSVSGHMVVSDWLISWLDVCSHSDTFGSRVELKVWLSLKSVTINQINPEF